MDSDGNLKAVAKALVTADEAWTPARTKLKRPSEWLVSMLRLTSASLNAGAPWNIGRVLAVQATLGESLWRPPAPNGWPDTEAAWIDGVPHCQRVCRTPALLRPGGAARERARSDRLAQYP
jgi:uncharacterized protein (DUF1800 family)